MGHIKLRWCCRLWYKVHYYTVTQVKYVLTYCQLICLYLQCRPITGQLHKFHRPGWFLWLNVAACTEMCTRKSVDLVSPGLRGSECVSPPCSKIIAIPCFLLIFFRFSSPYQITEMLLFCYTPVVCVFWRTNRGRRQENWTGMFLTKCSLLEKANMVTIGKIPWKCISFH